jgi:hypothetical protein
MSVTSLNLLEAGEAVGRSKATILKAIQRGRISASKDAMGGWCIEPVELHRVYPPLNGATPGNPSVNDGELAELRGRLSEMQDTVADLRRRLDREGEERRQAQTQLMALLADQRRPWWRFSR